MQGFNWNEPNIAQHSAALATITQASVFADQALDNKIDMFLGI